MCNHEEITIERPTLGIPWFKIFLGLILGISMIYVYYMIVLQTRNLKELILGINPIIYLFAFIFGFIGVIFFSFSWKIIANAQDIDLSTKDSISLTFVAYFFEGLVPAGMVPGDAIRTYLVVKRTSVPGETVISSIFAHRLAGMLPYSINGLLCVILLIQHEYSLWLSLIIGFLGLISVIAFIGLMIASLKEGFMANIVKKVINFLKYFFPFWRSRLELFEESSLKDINQFSISMRKLVRKKRKLLGSFILATTWWLCNGISFYAVIRAFNFQIDFLIILAVYTVVSTIRSLPLPLVGGFGLIELTLATLLQPVGVPEGIALAAPVLARNVFWFLVVCSSLFLLREYRRWLIKNKNDIIKTIQ